MVLNIEKCHLRKYNFYIKYQLEFVIFNIELFHQKMDFNYYIITFKVTEEIHQKSIKFFIANVKIVIATVITNRSIFKSEMIFVFKTTKSNLFNFYKPL